MENKWSIFIAMETFEAPRPKKKRGPAKRFHNMVDTHLYLPPDLLDWAKAQEEGFAPLVRRVLTAERQRRERMAARPH
jgi:hypothetical protein